MGNEASPRIRSKAEVVADIAARLERLPFTRYQLILFTVIATAWFFDSIDLGAITFLLGPIRSEFHLTTAAAGGLSSMSFIGMCLGAGLAGIAADRFGRMTVFQVSMFFWGAGSILCGLAPSLRMLMLARAVVGFGMGMEFPIAQAIASELVPKNHRGKGIAILEGFWPLGFIAAGVVALFFVSRLGWRGVFILEGVPAAFVFIVRRVIPESPRWLADHGDYFEAEESMRTIESNVEKRLKNKTLPPPVIATQVKEGPPRAAWTFLDLWAPQYRPTTTMLWLLWFFALLGFYGLTTWLNTLVQRSWYPYSMSVKFTLWVSCAGIVGFIAAALLIERMGRRWLCIAALVGSAVAAYFYGTASNVPTLWFFGLFMQFFLFAMWSVLYAYTAELYPTHARATGAGFASAVGRVGSLLGPFIVGIILPKVGEAGVFALGALCFLAAAFSVLIFGQESRLKALEDIAPTGSDRQVLR
jgi:putative MFS transporter